MTRPDPMLFWRDFDALSVHQLHAILYLRNAVFVVEQACPYQDIDGRDPEARHLLGWDSSSDTLAATLRIFAPKGEGNDHVARIGRIVTAPDHRGTGLGSQMIRAAISEIHRLYGPVIIEIGAQAHLEPYYARFGFARTPSQAYLEDGIPHVDMRMKANTV